MIARRWLAIAAVLATAAIAATVSPATAQPEDPPAATGDRSQAVSPFPDQPECVAWPTDRWRRGPLSPEIDLSSCRRT